ncbi:hypothetical protein BSG1_16610 [Bacillus sp. SG-1]|nr:hypothetical protein BSG1_16610 [Bacillus sp. SG-1]
MKVVSAAVAGFRRTGGQPAEGHASALSTLLTIENFLFYSCPPKHKLYKLFWKRWRDY